MMPYLAKQDPGNHLQLAGDKKSPDFYRSKQAKQLLNFIHQDISRIWYQRVNKV
jgi:hypothetical protein